MENASRCPYLETIGARWEARNLTEGTFKNLVAITTINSIAVVPTIALNGLAIIAVATRQRLRSKSNMLLAFLAVTDLCLGLLSQPLRIALELKRIFNVGPFCTVVEKGSILISVALRPATVGHLVLISIDRYIAIKKPLRYRRIVTKRRMTTGVVFVWAVTLFVTIQEIILASIQRGSSFYYVYVTVYSTIFGIIMLVSIAAIMYVYFYIFSETRRQKRLQIDQLSFGEAQRIRKDKKAANTLGFIVCVLVLTCLPVTVTQAIIILGKETAPRVANIVTSWGFTLRMLGSLCNPVIYCWRIKRMRLAFMEILHLRQPEKSSSAIEMQVINRYRREIQPSASEPFSVPLWNKEPILVSFSLLRAEEIISTEENHQI